MAFLFLFVENKSTTRGRQRQLFDTMLVGRKTSVFLLKRIEYNYFWCVFLQWRRRGRWPPQTTRRFVPSSTQLFVAFRPTTCTGRSTCWSGRSNGAQRDSNGRGQTLFCVSFQNTFYKAFRHLYSWYLDESLICVPCNSPRSIYREIMFLSLVALGKENIDVGEWNQLDTSCWQESHQHFYLWNSENVSCTMFFK